jgi:polyphosphate kinase
LARPFKKRKKKDMALHVYTFNRDLSWLAFNERVLEEAQNPNNPLLERVRFLSISARNLDEFFMVRVAHLKSQLENAIRHEEISLGDGLSPKERLDQVINRSYALMKLQENCWISLQDELKKNNVLVLKLEELTAC